MKTLITLGPTQEPIDDVRYITNDSSGKMGKALAEESLARNFSTTIISGPVSIELPPDAKIFQIRTTSKMIDKTLLELEKNYDIFISTAAIADYSPNTLKGKMSSQKKEINLKLKLNPKLTNLVRKKFPSLYVVGFKAECGLQEEKLAGKALKKLTEENLDMVIANDLSSNPFGSDENEVYIVKINSIDHLEKNSKESLAREIWNKILEDVKTKK